MKHNKNKFKRGLQVSGAHKDNLNNQVKKLEKKLGIKQPSHNKEITLYY